MRAPTPLPPTPRGATAPRPRRATRTCARRTSRARAAPTRPARPASRAVARRRTPGGGAPCCARSRWWAAARALRIVAAREDHASARRGDDPPDSGWQVRAQHGVALDDFPLDDAGERATRGHRGGTGGATQHTGRSSSPTGRSSPAHRRRIQAGAGAQRDQARVADVVVAEVPQGAVGARGAALRRHVRRRQPRRPPGRPPPLSSHGTAASSARGMAVGGGAKSGDVSLKIRSKAAAVPIAGHAPAVGRGCATSRRGQRRACSTRAAGAGSA